MENLLLKEIVKVLFMLVSPLVVIVFIFYYGQPVIAISFFIGVLLGVYRLKALFNCVNYVLNHEKSNKSVFLIIKYVASIFISLGAIGFTLYRSITIGVPLLLGLTTVPIAVTVYAIWKGILLYKK